MSLPTTDLTDSHPDLAVAEPIFRDFGGSSAFAGPIETVKVFEDNVLVRATLETPGKGRVLVVDGGGSLRRALVGDIVAGLGVTNGWVGIIINGCVRDTAVTAKLDIGIKALAALPKRSDKFGNGQVSVPVRFAGVDFEPGDWVYADADGIVVAPGEMNL
jgi:regulator of ribonuclease activity A